MRDDEKVDNNNEGRVLTLEYPDFYLVNCYVPNAKLNVKRRNYRFEFNRCFCDYVGGLNNIKNVIVCGDFNVAHKNIDMAKKYRQETLDGFNDEQADFNDLLNIGLIDIYRILHPIEEMFTWFFDDDYENINQGWRLDYFLTSEELEKYILKTEIKSDVIGSDHKPVEMEMKQYE